MTSSKSNSWLLRALVLFLVLLGGTAFAEGRKRLVILDFEGDDAEKIQTSLGKFLKKHHTVIETSKWTSTADEMGATKINEKNVKKVAKKLKIDGIVSGNVEKRRDEYIIRIKLRSGATGALVGNQVNIKSDEPKLSKQSKTDLEDELFGQIDALKEVRGEDGGEEPADEPPPKDESKPSKFGKHDEEEKPAKDGKIEKTEKKDEKKDEKKEEKEALTTKKDEPKKEEEENPLPKPKKETKKEKEEKEEKAEKTEKTEKKVKKVSKKKEEGEEEEGVEEGPGEGTEDASARAGLLSPGKRAVDAVIGVSINMRKMSFTYANDIGTRPAGYQGKPVPGGFFDMNVYPLSLGHKRDDILANIGFTGMYDQVLLVKSKDKAGNELKSAQSRFAIGAVFRYPFNKSASSPVVGARLRYGQQNFKISQPAPLPSVTYTIIDPGAFFRMPIGQKIVLDLNASFLLITNTGQMQQADKYGAATVTGFEFNLGADYNLTNTVFVRGLFNYETIGYSFNGAAGTGMLPTPTDNQKVSGARDSFYGAIITGGYLF